jgi:hypothetical protein
VLVCFVLQVVVDANDSYPDADTWGLLCCSDTGKIAGESVRVSSKAEKQFALELPLNSFQPALCHPLFWDKIKKLKEDQKARAAAKAVEGIKPDLVPCTQLLQNPLPEIDICDSYPIAGFPHSDVDFFSDPGGSVLSSNFLWSFWMYNALRITGSIQSNTIATGLLNWTGRKLKNQMTVAAQTIWGKEVKLLLPVSVCFWISTLPRRLLIGTTLSIESIAVVH